MDTEPFFSVIIPTYNRVAILNRAIDSVLNQTFSNFELIIVDNGSTDHTSNWLRQNYSDPRIQYYCQKGTGSPAGPRNTGIRLSTGKWISFLDSDDFWRLNKLQSVKQAIDQDSILDVICHDEYLNMMGKEVNSVLRYGPYEKNFYRVLLIGGNRLSTSATSIRRSFLQHHQLSFNESPHYMVVEDYDLWLKLAQKGAKFGFVRQPLGDYVVDEGSLSLDLELKRRNVENMLRNHVYSIQTFTNNKDFLWQCIQFRIMAGDFKSSIKNNGFFSILFQLVKKVIATPNCAIQYMKIYVVRKWRISRGF